MVIPHLRNAGNKLFYIIIDFFKRFFLLQHLDSARKNMAKLEFLLMMGDQIKKMSDDIPRIQCCILTSDPTKHAIPKTAEVHIPLAWTSLADNMGQG